MNYKSSEYLPAHFVGHKKTAAQMQADAQSILHGTVFHDDAKRSERMGKIANHIAVPFLTKKATKRHEEPKEESLEITPEVAAALQLAEAQQAAGEQDVKGQADIALLESLAGDEGKVVTAALTDEQAMNFLLTDPDGQRLAKHAEQIGREQAWLDARHEALEKGASAEGLAEGLIRGGKSNALRHAAAGALVTGTGEAILDPNASVGRVVGAAGVGAAGAGTISHLGGRAMHGSMMTGAKSTMRFGHPDIMKKLSPKAISGINEFHDAATRIGQTIQSGGLGGAKVSTDDIAKLTRNQKGVQDLIDLHHAAGHSETATAMQATLDKVNAFTSPHAGSIATKPTISIGGKKPGNTPFAGVVQSMMETPDMILGLGKTTTASEKTASPEALLLEAAERGASKGRMLSTLLSMGAGGTAGALSDEDHRVRNAVIGAGVAAPLGYGAHALAGGGAMKALRGENMLQHALVGMEPSERALKVAPEHQGMLESVINRARKLKGALQYSAGGKVPEITPEVAGDMLGIHRDLGNLQALSGQKQSLLDALETHMPKKTLMDIYSGAHSGPAFANLGELGNVHEELAHYAGGAGGGKRSLLSRALGGGGSIGEGGGMLSRGPLGMAARHPALTSMVAVPAGAAAGSLMTGPIHNREDARRDVRNMGIGGGTALGASVLPALLAAV